jgi:valyl-tRNA synthetase
VADVRRLMDDYQYGEAGKIIYDFIWNDLCDWYVEMSKLSLNAPLLVRTLDTALRLLHPFMPYVTEELWQKLKEVAGGSDFRVPSFASAALILAPFPATEQWSIDNGKSSIADMSALQDVIRAIRNARSEYKVEPNKRVSALVQAGARAAMLNDNRAAIESLARVEGLTIAEMMPAPPHAMTYALGEVTVYLPMAGLVDQEAEKKRLTDELAAIEGQIVKSEALLASDFAKRAPAQVIEKEKAKLAEAQAKREQLKERLA